jgi:hypothetical protein
MVRGSIEVNRGDRRIFLEARSAFIYDFSHSIYLIGIKLTMIYQEQLYIYRYIYI